MTTKEIAELLGKDESTVRRWAKRAAGKSPEAAGKLHEAQNSGGKPADWTLDEAISIVEVGLGKNAASLFRENASRQLPMVVSSESTIDEAFKLALITLTNLAQNLDSRMSKIELRIEERQALPPPPQKKPRDHISEIVRGYAVQNAIEFFVAWNMLYKEFSYRTNTNPRTCALNRKMAIVDYIESEGLIETLESIAIEYLK